jgi:hypothetical protein
MQWDDREQRSVGLIYPRDIFYDTQSVCIRAEGEFSCYTLCLMFLIIVPSRYTLQRFRLTRVTLKIKVSTLSFPERH